MMKELNKNSLEKYAADGKMVLVEFSAPWCVYCRRLAPAMEKVAEEYKDILTVGTVNIDNEPELARREKIEVVPTLVLYKNGQAVDRDPRRRLRLLFKKTVKSAVEGKQLTGDVRSMEKSAESIIRSGGAG